jgi:epoxyqueuosine reductase
VERRRPLTSAGIKELAHACGFDLAGITTADPPAEAAYYSAWLEQGYAGEMGYLYGRRAELRRDVRALLPSARSVICLGLLYNTPWPYSTARSESQKGWISRYAWGEDYHDVMRRRMRFLVGRLCEAADFEWKVCVDTSPVLERAYAQRAGLGWIGQNTCLINQQIGSWVFLGEILTSLEVEPDSAPPFRCGTCRRCIEACPTQALVPTGRPQGPAFALDSRLCISYWTIELRGPIPPEHRAGAGTQVFGCDICQDVCPWNRRAAATADPAFAPRRSEQPDLEQLAKISEAEFRDLFRASPVERARYAGFLRNVAVAMGNTRNPALRPALEKLARHPEPLVREHACWALAQLEPDLVPPGSCDNLESLKENTAHMPIAVGQPAPDFTLKDQNQKELRLSEFRGKNVLLAFYPLDWSPVCTKEHACFVEDLKSFENLEAQVIGISVDSAWSHKAYAEKMGISYPLLADFEPKGAVASKFGLYLADKGITNRATVIVDKQGIVRYVNVYEIPTQRSNQELVGELQKLH